MASKRQERRKACEGKVQYKTAKDAAIAAHEVSDKMKEDGGRRQGFYRCPFCKQFHTGHLPLRIRKIIQSRRG